jgi:hypothetical protein
MLVEPLSPKLAQRALSRARFGVSELDRRGGELERDFDFLCQLFTPRTVFLEAGARDCELALRAAGYVERVYAAAQSRQGAWGMGMSGRAPSNMRLLTTDGVRMPVPDGVVDVAFSRDVVGRLDERRLAEHLRDLRRSLTPGGVYVFDGDVSALRGPCLLAGFSRLRSYVRVGGRYLRCPFFGSRIAAVN